MHIDRVREAAATLKSAAKPDQPMLPKPQHTLPDLDQQLDDKLQKDLCIMANISVN